MDFLREWEEKLAIKITCSQVMLFQPNKFQKKKLYVHATDVMHAGEDFIGCCQYDAVYLHE